VRAQHPNPGGAGRIPLLQGAAAGYEDVVTGDVRQLTDGQGRDLTAYVQDTTSS
jgi:hypothetical protein